MDAAHGPTLAELLEALPPDVEPRLEGGSAPAREELEAFLAELGRRPIASGRLPRLWALGTLQARIALAYLAWWLRGGFQDAERRRQGLEETHVAAALAVVGRMAALRGAVMKLGQVLAHWPDVLPQAFADVLGRLHAEAPPMHFALLREHVQSELGRDPHELFDDFEERAFAAASLGQVHRARLKGSGRRVAVKIQYPDIARTIRGDLANLKAASFPLRLSGDWQNLLEQFEGIQRMLEQETDYEAEARLQEDARRSLGGLEGVVVPRVVPELSTRRVLTSEYLEGVHLERFLAGAPEQGARDLQGARIARAALRLWYRERLVYADPHPGNYLFLADGRLGLLDFGCCHRFDEDEFDYVLAVERAASARDEARLVEELARGCALAPEELDGERRQRMLEYCDWLWAPVRTDEPFDYGAPGQFEPGVRLYGEFTRRRWVRSLPVNVWLTKVFFGVRAMLTRLEARVPYGRILREESVL